MNKIKNPMIAAAVLAGLALIGSLMNSHPAVLQAAGGPTVTIDPSQLPLHVTGATTVTGAVTVAGTVAATQSGPWNVGITGTPTVTLASGASVQARNVDEPGRNPFQVSVQTYFNSAPCGTFACDFNLGQVPNGKRLVITNISGQVWVTSGVASGVNLNTHSSANATDIPVSVVAFNPTTNICGLNATLKLFFDAGDTLYLNVPVSGQLTAQTGYITVSGYYVSLP